MSHRRAVSALIAVVLFVSVGALTGCAVTGGSCATGSGRAGASETQVMGTVLEYRMVDGAPMSYRFTNDVSQVMEVRDQTIPVEFVQSIAFSVDPTGVSGDDYSLRVTIDDLAVSASSPQRNVEADVGGVVGASFGMTLSRIGEEGGLPEAESLQYDMPSEGPRSIVPTFSVMFPDLPGRPVSVGDSWPSSVRMTEPSGSGEADIALDSVNTLEGFETVRGRECARISSVFSGTITGSGAQGGLPWTMTSDITGSGVWYFDHENGVCVSETSEGDATGEITVETPDGTMVMPTTRDFVLELGLIE